jgi:hypothetical protein
MRILSILALGAIAYAVDPRDAQTAAAEKSFGKCWDTRDTECLSRLVTDDFVQITRTATMTDKAGFLEGIKAGKYSQSNSNAPDPPLRNVKFRYYGNTAIQTYVVTGPGPSSGGSSLR